MNFQMPNYKHPDFDQEPFLSAPDARIVGVEIDGVAPEHYHALSIYPEYFKINGEWILASESRMDGVPVLRTVGTIEVVEFRNLQVGDKAVKESMYMPKALVLTIPIQIYLLFVPVVLERQLFLKTTTISTNC